MVEHWNKFPGEAVDTPTLAVFKDTLDNALSNLIEWKASLPTAGELRTG